MRTLTQNEIEAVSGGYDVPAWLVIGLYEGTIPMSAIADNGYGDFDWANMTPAQRLALYGLAQGEAQSNS